jgi:hypothetical protein
MKFDTFFHGLLRKRGIRGDPCFKSLAHAWFPLIGGYFV